MWEYLGNWGAQNSQKITKITSSSFLLPHNSASNSCILLSWKNLGTLWGTNSQKKTKST